jgi:hypothetical protein
VVAAAGDDEEFRSPPTPPPMEAAGGCLPMLLDMPLLANDKSFPLLLLLSNPRGLPTTIAGFSCFLVWFLISGTG